MCAPYSRDPSGPPPPAPPLVPRDSIANWPTFGATPPRHTHPKPPPHAAPPPGQSYLAHTRTRAQQGYHLFGTPLIPATRRCCCSPSTTGGQAARPSALSNLPLLPPLLADWLPTNKVAAWA